MTIEVSEQLEPVLKQEAAVRGISPTLFVHEVLARELGHSVSPQSTQPFKSGLGMWSKYGISLSEEDIDENRADMLRNTIFAPDAE